MNTRRPYIGVSGFMYRGECRAVLGMYKELWLERDTAPTHDLMCGVLLSEKTLLGDTNKYWGRYPARGAVDSIFLNENLLLNIAHYSSDEAPSAETLALLSHVAGPHCDGFQFNGVWPTYKVLAGELPTGSGVILQHRIQAVVHTAEISDMLTLAPLATDILLDGSCGSGTAYILSRLRANLRVCHESTWYGCLSTRAWPNFTVAGGLDADLVPGLEPLVREFPGLSIDAESRLRDGADAGGNLDLNKVYKYLQAAVKLFTESSK